VLLLLLLLLQIDTRCGQHPGFSLLIKRHVKGVSEVALSVHEF
jgi:hypothetical protein